MHPLDGIKVLDLSRVLAGPLCAMTLGDLGADVWKVENPAHGDDTRTWYPPSVGGEATYFLSANRNKRSIAIDLKTAQGQELVLQLARHADVLVENMKFETLDRMGLGWENLRKINPRLIYCSISGYGRKSPNAHLPGYDVIGQAESGLMAVTGERGGGPLKHGMAIVDIVTGFNAVQAILAAMFAREKTGEGQFIDMALLDSGIAMLANTGTGFINTGTQPPRWGNAHPTIVPYQVFDAADGTFVLGCGNDVQFKLLASKVLGRPDLATDPRFARNPDRISNRDELIAILEKAFLMYPARHWIQKLQDAGVPAGEVRDLDAVFGSADAKARQIVRRQFHPTIGEVATIASPLRLADTPPSYRRPPPVLGQHTRELLSEVLGITDTSIEMLLAQGIVSDHQCNGGGDRHRST
jgi:crotonobetainyl-CoA:carnitine CoA-transferase CaiB-like acyl-CoA transferase